MKTRLKLFEGMRLPIMLVVVGVVFIIIWLDYRSHWLMDTTCSLWLTAIGWSTYKTIKTEHLSWKDSMAFIGLMFMVSMVVILLCGYHHLLWVKILFFVGMGVAVSKLLRHSYRKSFGSIGGKVIKILLLFYVLWLCRGISFWFFPEFYTLSESTAGEALLSILGWLVFVAMTSHLLFPEKSKIEGNEIGAKERI